MKTPFLFLLIWVLVWSGIASAQQPSRTTPVGQGRYLALDVHGLTGFQRYRYLEGDEINVKVNGDRYRAPVTAVTDSSFSIAVQNEIMDRTENLTIRFADVDRIYERKRIPFVSGLAFVLPVAGVTYAVADYVNPKSLDGRTGRFRFDPQTLIPSGAMLVAGAVFYRLSYPSYRVGKRNRLRAF